jgi:hypothetical protein
MENEADAAKALVELMLESETEYQTAIRKQYRHNLVIWYRLIGSNSLFGL